MHSAYDGQSAWRFRCLVLCLIIVFTVSFSVSVLIFANAEKSESTVSRVRLAAGKGHSALVLQDGSLYTWGDNTYGQLGFADTDYSDHPRQVTESDRVVDVRLGADHSLFLTDDGDVFAMGRNSFGQLGNSTTLHSDHPVQVMGLPPVEAIVCGLWHSLALCEDGSVWGWGDNTAYQLGDDRGDAIQDASGQIIGYRHLTPVQIIPDSIDAIAAGGSFSLAIHSDQKLLAWGDNSRGQLGDGTQQTRTKPTTVPGLTRVRAVAAGFQHVLAVVDDSDSDQLYTWGDNNSGQLGLGSQSTGDAYKPLPHLVELTDAEGRSFEQIHQISAGYAYSIATVASHTTNHLSESDRVSILVWGDNTFGQLGLGHTDQKAQPQLLSGQFNGFTGSSFLPMDAVAAGGSHTLAVSSKGLMAAAGLGDRGQLGTRSILSRLTLTSVPIPDVIRPGWTAEANLSATRDHDGQIVLRWPKAQDNIQVAGYRLLLRWSDGSESETDIGQVQHWTIPKTDDSRALSVSVFSYDSASQDLSSEYLSRLSAFLPPTEFPQSIESDYFTESSQTIRLIHEKTHRWRPSDTGILEPLEVPWDVQPVYGSEALPKPPQWSWVFNLSMISAGLIIVSLIWILIKQNKHQNKRPAVKPPAVDIKRI